MGFVEGGKGCDPNGTGLCIWLAFIGLIWRVDACGKRIYLASLVKCGTINAMFDSVFVSVITTVFNEAESIDRLLTSLAAQTRVPDEIVICDGGSSDGTVAQIEAWVAQSMMPVKLIVEPRANISRGRNLAIAAARGPVIAVTDAGVRLDPTWLEHLVAPWTRATPGCEPVAVAGFFLPDVDGAFQSAMAATVLPLRDDVRPEQFLPSSRSVAFTKAAWATTGGYPEWLDYCEDLLFDFAINELHPDQPTAFVWAPDAVVYFRPRTNLRSFWTQYYRYARGDGKANLWPKRHAIRYFIYLVVFPALIGHGLWGMFARPLGWVGLLVGLWAYCRRPWQRLALVGHKLSWSERMRATLWVPVIRAVGDAAKMVGYPVGRWWRIWHYFGRMRDEG
jgi:glycosyltransferase involved in cell wall biosynthesis